MAEAQVDSSRGQTVMCKSASQRRGTRMRKRAVGRRASSYKLAMETMIWIIL